MREQSISDRAAKGASAYKACSFHELFFRAFNYKPVPLFKSKSSLKKKNRLFINTKPEESHTEA